MTKRLLIVFHDDSSLFMARSLADDLSKWAAKIDFLFIEANAGEAPKLSESQLSESLAGLQIAYRRTQYRAFDEQILKKDDAVISAKFPVSFRKRAIERSWRFKSRPCFISVFPGIEFFPERGFEIRGMFDIIALNSVSDRELYEHSPPSVAPAHQQQIVCNPYFVERNLPPTSETKKDIVFFTQSVTPASREGRAETLKVLARIAKENPSYRVIIKLRHLEDENKNHTHIEQHSYQSIANELRISSLFQFRTGSTKMCLENCAFALTCSSTAGIQAISQDIPTAFLTGFDGWQKDNIAIRAQKKFSTSGLLVDVSEAHLLNFATGNTSWRKQNLASIDCGDQLLKAIERFHNNPPRDTGIMATLRGLRQTIKDTYRNFRNKLPHKI